MGITSNQKNPITPQNGTEVTVVDTVSLVGNFVMENARTDINHLLTWIAYLGREYKNGVIYLGAGPAGFESHVYEDRVVGFARINGTPTDITGPSRNSSIGNKWSWGATAQIGTTYYLNPTWFVDINYEYSFSGNYATESSADFTTFTHSIFGAFKTNGFGLVTNTQRFTVQGINVTINKVFDV